MSDTNMSGFSIPGAVRRKAILTSHTSSENLVKIEPLVQYPLADRRNEENSTSLPRPPDRGDSNETMPNMSSSHWIGARQCPCSPNGFAIGIFYHSLYVSRSQFASVLTQHHIHLCAQTRVAGGSTLLSGSVSCFSIGCFLPT